jgi:hypothetical protein
LRSGRRAAFAIALAGAVLAGGGASAHRLDEYLQAARIDIDTARVRLELDLTPGVAVADTIVAEIDDDRNGAISPEEKRAYRDHVLGALRMQVDGTWLRLDAVASTFPDLDAIRRGEGTIRLQAAAPLPSQRDGSHQLVFRNNYRPHVSAYLANALVPADPRVAVTAQERDANQSRLTIDYVVHPATSRLPIWVLSAGAAVALFAAGFFRLKAEATESRG